MEFDLKISPTQGNEERFAVIRREVQYDGGIQIMNSADIVAFRDDIAGAESEAAELSSKSGYSRENHDGGDTPNDALWFEAETVTVSGLSRAIVERAEYKTVSGRTLSHISHGIEVDN